jgi:hypothetical protein
MVTPVADARRWTRTGSSDARGGGPAGRAPRSRAAWSGVIGLGRGAEQDPCFGVVEHQGDGLDADADELPGEDLGGKQPVGA